MTKPDLIDAGTEKGLISIINNETYPLKKGYSCVRCRGQKAIDEGQTLAQAIQQDTDFFSSAPHFRLVCVPACVHARVSLSLSLSLYSFV